ncbi:MAG: hypothetical protein Q9195_006366 [Heterodermia aff. obscurata]
MPATLANHGRLSTNFMSLPRELRNDIFRYFAISRLDAGCPAIFRPVGIDDHMYRIGYFEKDTVIPLLLVCRKFHEEVAAVLYGENTFAFHISGLSEGPVAFLERLSPRYFQLLTKVYIRTGHMAADRGLSYSVPAETSESTGAQEKRLIDQRRQLAISTMLVKEAWPARYGVQVDSANCETCEIADSPVTIRDSRRIGNGSWPHTVGHLWKMTIDDLASGETVRSCRRIKWLHDDSEYPQVVTFDDAES